MTKAVPTKKSTLSGLLRTRVILSVLGLILVLIRPDQAQWICILVGMSLGVSAIDAMKQGASDGQK